MPEQDKERKNDQADEKPVEGLESTTGGCGGFFPEQAPEPKNPVDPTI